MRNKFAAELVFVYGTLRRGQRNHQLLETSQFMGSYTTDAIYTMISLGSYPGVLANGRSAITGEVYRVTRSTMTQLDTLEDYPEAYDRMLIHTDYGRAWVYIYRHVSGKEPVIDSGDWLDK